MADIHWQPMTLPSQGVLYCDPNTTDELLPGGKIEIRKTTGNEDAVLLSQGLDGLDRIAKIINTCSRIPKTDPSAPERITQLDLLLTDRMAILLALRTLAFNTPWYNYSYKCQYCNKTTKAWINLVEDLPERSPESIADTKFAAGEINDPSEFTLREPITLDLVDERVQIQVRFLRGHDEAKIAKRAKRLAMTSNDLGDQSAIYRQALQIVTIDGEERKEAHKEAFVRQLSSHDLAQLRIAVDDVEPGLDLRIFPTCDKCGADNELSLPFTAEFFRPTTFQPRNA
jgi:hypothetical protein